MTSASIHVHLKGKSGYHCDQTGNSATIKCGEGGMVSITASSEDFLYLAQACKEAAKRIALKKIQKISEEIDRELEKQFPD